MRSLYILSLTVIIAAAATAQPMPSASLEQEIRQQFSALEHALIQRDSSAIERLVGDDYFFTDPGTNVSGKKEMLEVARSDDYVYERHEVVDLSVAEYGITAVSHGRFMVVGRYKGQLWSHPVQFTAVHVRRDGRWQLVALHSTVKPEAK